jgi:hypothetical protein
MFRRFIFCFFLILMSSVQASNKNNIIENLQNTKNFNFEFEQNINGKSRKWKLHNSISLKRFIVII